MKTSTTPNQAGSAEVKSGPVSSPPAGGSVVPSRTTPENQLDSAVLPAHPPRRNPLRLVKRILKFWSPPTDAVQLSLFGPLQLAPGHATKLQAFAHRPTEFSHVRTLARALNSKTELLAAGYLDREVPLREAINIHLALRHCNVSEPMLSVTWDGQPPARTFVVFVPWESPAGITPAALSAGVDGVQVASIPFQIEIKSRLI